MAGSFELPKHVVADLVDSVIAFANAPIDKAADVPELFARGWKPSGKALPNITQCRRIQADVRKWLGGNLYGGVPAMLGFGARDKESEGIRLDGALGFKATNEKGSPRTRHRITWDWWFRPDTPLRALCGLGVACILHDELEDKVGVCAREGCGTYFIDWKSRGVRRKYCKTEECQKALNRERVNRSRAQ